MNPRQTTPFYTVPKPAVKLIRESVEGTDTAFCLNAFHALRLLANNAGKADGPVTTTVLEIARNSGCGYKRAMRSLHQLQAIGVIEIKGHQIPGTKGRAPSDYIFIPIGPTFGTVTPAGGAEIGKEEKEKKSPHSPPVGGGEVSSERSNSKTRVRFHSRLPNLDTLHAQVEGVGREIEDILRPGGCAHYIEPTDPAKKARLMELMKVKTELKVLINNTRAELSRRMMKTDTSEDNQDGGATGHKG